MGSGINLSEAWKSPGIVFLKKCMNPVSTKGLSTAEAQTISVELAVPPFVFAPIYPFSSLYQALDCLFNSSKVDLNCL